MIQNEENKHNFLSKRKINDKQMEKINKLEEYFDIVDKSNCLWTGIVSSSPIKERKKEKVKFDVKHNSPPQRKSTNYSIFTANQSEDLSLSVSNCNEVKYSFSEKKDFSISKIQWSEEDDRLLIYLRDEKKIATWVEISKYFHDKNPKQCSYRHKKLTYIYKSPWNEEEDLNLIREIMKSGDNFEYLKHLFQNRSMIELKKRYFSFLIKVKEITSTEDNVLMEIFNKKSICKEKFNEIKKIHYKISYYRLIYLLKYDLNSNERMSLLDLIRSIYIKYGMDEESDVDISSPSSPSKKTYKRSESISNFEIEKGRKSKLSLNSDFNKMFMKMISIENHEYKSKISNEECYNDDVKLEFKLFPLDNDEDNYIENNINMNSISNANDFNIEHNDYDLYSQGLNMDLNENISSHYENSIKGKSSNSLLNSNLYKNESIFNNHHHNENSLYDNMIENINNNQLFTYHDTLTKFDSDILYKSLFLNSNNQNKEDKISISVYNNDVYIRVMTYLEKLLDKLNSSSVEVSDFIKNDKNSLFFKENKEKFDFLHEKEKNLTIELLDIRKSIGNNHENLLVYIDLLIKLIVIHKDRLNLIRNKQ